MNCKNKFLILLIFIFLGFTACNLFQFRSLQAFQESEILLQTATDSLPDQPIYEQFTCVYPDQSYQTARVIKVIDGDSIVVKLNGSLFEVRYIGINTPEYDSDERSAAILATQANEDLLFGKEVFLFKDVSNTDKYGRLLRYVFTDKEFVNLEMVLKGFALPRAYPPDTSCQTLFNQNEE
jgi:endonuclease YncB( thermonuclease family)